MPELPEVEALRQGLEKYLLGNKIERAIVKRPKLVSGLGNIRIANSLKTKAFEKGLRGQIFLKIERRAKNLIFHFKSGGVLIVHLKMTGQLVYKDKHRAIEGGHPIELSEDVLPHKHTHIIFELKKGTLYYNDIRQFGYLLYYPTLRTFEKENHFKGFGPEPLSSEFNLPEFHKSLTERNTKLKTALLDQQTVVGLGNIYCDEVCFGSKLLPIRNTKTLSLSETKQLFNAIRKILPRATALGGSSVANYRLADGSRGNYAREHKVYGRAGKPCFVCKRKLSKLIMGGRTTVFCGKCQK